MAWDSRVDQLGQARIEVRANRRTNCGHIDEGVGQLFISPTSEKHADGVFLRASGD